MVFGGLVVSACMGWCGTGFGVFGGLVISGVGAAV